MRSAGVDEVLEPASLRPEVRLNEAPPVIGSVAQMLLTGSENGFQAAGPVEHCVDPCRDIPGIGRVAPSHEVSQNNDQLSHVHAPFPVPGLQIRARLREQTLGERESAQPSELLVERLEMIPGGAL